MPHKEQLEFENRMLKRQILQLQEAAQHVFTLGFYSALDDRELEDALHEVLLPILNNKPWTDSL